ncbi:TupA-like ATPgrasp [Pseudobutyrivibrio sp. UC1225]|uniref:ATP-grasp fold amidoligase family protein n=1 Tax=Pseudobutyrivibrio sp. UC1225 TaxID=1798185 RepID=UPI0008E9E819|nr:ATP-grasp fold amidoligase family protein [Pseudobutyrivibrio sp. UC1225]SFN78717.1 TupA-like ATPgrasp [Pseudobutyrivibrio sp. UC1225]
MLKKIYLLIENACRFIPDRMWIKFRFIFLMKKKCNLDNPKSFSEKIQWLKLNEHFDEYTSWCDKVEAKNLVKPYVGEEHIIPTIGVWDDFDEIDFDKLPEKFVLKCNHDSGGVVICKDKEHFDKKKARAKLRQCLHRDYYLNGREWPYKNIERKILAEPYIEPEKGKEELTDYKFMVFNGEVKCTFTCTDRYSSGLKVTFFDKGWNVLPFDRKYPRSTEKIEKPKNYEWMIEVAEEIAHNWRFARVDFFEVGEKAYFGEVTFYPGSGMERFYPEKWDYILGSWLRI